MKRYLFLLTLTTTFLLSASFADTLGLTGDANVAQADDVQATRSAAIMASPGEQARAVTRVRAGTKMTVLERKGRWLKVRVNGRTGWITQSNVSSGQARTPVRKQRRRAFVEGRSKSRSSDRKGAPSDRVGADAMASDGFDDDEDFDDDDFDDDDDDDDEGFDDDDDDDDAEVAPETVVATAKIRMRRKPSNKAKAIGKARSGDRLFVIERDGSWIKVENNDGETGWVRSSDVENGSFKYKKYNMRYFGSLGYEAISQDFSTPNDCTLCNYKLSSGAMAINLGGEVIYDYSKEYLVAGEANYRYTRANPGIRFVDPNDGTPADISFQVHRIDVGARVGYKLGKATGMAAYGRVGYHYNRFGVDEVENFAVNLPRIPSEILSGFTVGVLLDVPQFNPKIAFRIGADILASGTRVQTAGLEDGQLSDSAAIWGHARLDYQWKPNMKVTGQYHYTGYTTKWQGMAEASMRDHASTEAQRNDVVHALFVGVSKAL